MPVFVLLDSRRFVPVLHRGLIVLGCAALCACGNFNNGTSRIANSLSPYKPDVVQGNFVSKEQVEFLRPGLTRAQVKEVLGSPLVTSAFHADRWDYVFTLNSQTRESQIRKLTVFFKGDDFVKVEGDPMPSEAEFVGTLSSLRNFGKAPSLVASEQELAAVQARSSTPSPAAVPTAIGSTGVVYPPLEAPTR